MATAVQSLIKKVGRGKTLARDLGREESRAAMRALLAGEFRPSQAGAFLQAMRIKEATLGELLGAWEALDERRLSAATDGLEGDLVVNLAFDTARKGGILSIPAAALLRSLGLARPVLVWEPPSLFRENRAVEATLEALRSSPSLAEWECPLLMVREMIDGWDALAELRSELGFRTILNTLEKLVLPVPAATAVAGISHGSFFGRLSEALLETGASRAVVVRGHHGTCDLGLGVEPVHYSCAVPGEPSAERELLVPTGLDATLLLASRLADWPALARTEDASWSAAVAEQAAFLLSAGTGASVESAREAIRSKEIEHVR
jgi:anthranilate phosphoribosyltransferase